MALARIITRSHACSRELALDLLARGYTVEIVSPEAIPDSLADLELRVDNAGDQLVANVTAHDGDRSTSLEFLHHLKAPMGDFIRRVPEIEEVPSVASPVRSEAVPVGLGAGDSEVVLPAVECSLFEERAGSRLADPVVESAIESGVFRGSDEQECVDTPSIGAMGALDPIERVSASSQANEIPVYFEQAEARRVQAFEAEPLLEAEASPRTASRAVIARFRSVASWWGWRVALTFATVVVLALLLGFGLRRTGKAVAQSSSNAEVEKIESVPNTGALIDASVAGKDAANNGRANTPLDQKVGGILTALRAAGLQTRPKVKRRRLRTRSRNKFREAMTTVSWLATQLHIWMTDTNRWPKPIQPNGTPAVIRRHGGTAAKWLLQTKLRTSTSLHRNQRNKIPGSQPYHERT